MQNELMDCLRDGVEGWIKGGGGGGGGMEGWNGMEEWNGMDGMEPEWIREWKEMEEWTGMDGMEGMEWTNGMDWNKRSEEKEPHRLMIHTGDIRCR